MPIVGEGVHHIAVDGLTIVCHVHGRGPICVAHPGGPGLDWDYLRMPSVEKHLTMVYVEPVGTGASGRLSDPSEYTMEVYVRHLDAVVRHFSADPVFVLGYSFGGFVAQCYALTGTDRIAGLILNDTAPATDEEFNQVARANFDAYLDANAGRVDREAMLQAFTDEGVVDDATATAAMRRILPAYFADYWSREHEFSGVAELFKSARDPGLGFDWSSFDVRDQLTTLRCPAAILVGAHDFICPPQWSRLMHDLIRGSTLTVFDESGRLPHIEEPQAFAATIAAFVGTVARP
ncbi:alpha/beta fold hydrolase [Micromonospora sp. DT4]|uniref:alpha/beta fold hydrolase n=1 Tax=Micromonospora sp. DT4 TaxID=3393438 RepID=UPI003CE9B157